MSTVEPKRILIAGSGRAGLTTADELCRRGALPLVFEQDRSVGGISRLEVFRGHRFFSREPRVNRIWEEMQGGRFTRARRLQNSKSGSPHRVPDTSRMSAAIDYFVNENDDLWRYSSDQSYHEGAVAAKE